MARNQLTEIKCNAPAKNITMEIRFAQKKDLVQIVDLCNEHAAYEKAKYDKSNKLELLSGAIFGQNPSLQCLVIEDNSLIIGYASFMKQFSTWDANLYIYLDCIFLKEAARGKGFGKLLMEKIKEYSKNENCSLIQWQTPFFNKKAIEFYLKIGAESKNKERFFLNI